MPPPYPPAPGSQFWDEEFYGVRAYLGQVAMQDPARARELWLLFRIKNHLENLMILVGILLGLLIVVVALPL